MTGTLGDAGWYTSDVGVSFTAVESNSDPLVLSDACDDSTAVTVDSAGQSVVCEAIGPGGTTTSTVVIKRDATQPVVDVTTVTDGATYLVGAVPGAGCAVSDVMSGPADTAPEPTGAGTTVGSHTVTCEGTDAAGNSATTQARYTVEEPPWHVNGFLEPVQTEIDVVNSVKGGKVVPLKFEIFEGTTEITELPDDLQLTLSRYACESTSDVTPVETADAGATALRYDGEEGVFIQNWKTPRTKGCYQVTLTLPAAGPPVVAHFLVR